MMLDNVGMEEQLRSNICMLERHMCSPQMDSQSFLYLCFALVESCLLLHVHLPHVQQLSLFLADFISHIHRHLDTQVCKQSTMSDGKLASLDAIHA